MISGFLNLFLRSTHKPVLTEAHTLDLGLGFLIWDFGCRVCLRVQVCGRSEDVLITNLMHPKLVPGSDKPGSATNRRGSVGGNPWSGSSGEKNPQPGRADRERFADMLNAHH